MEVIAGDIDCYNFSNNAIRLSKTKPSIDIAVLHLSSEMSGFLM
jgi:hypothetical protein